MAAATVQPHATLEPFLVSAETEVPVGGAHSLTVPYAVRMSKAPIANQTLSVRGVVKPNAGRFEINLLNGVSYAAQLESTTIPRQVPLHCCFHFEVGISVMNSYMDGDWGYEECHLNPCVAGAPFEIKICVGKDGYEVFGNEKRIGAFKHRVDPRAVDYVQVRGDIELQSVEWSDPI